MAPKLETGEAHPPKPDARSAGPAICGLPTDADASGRFSIWFYHNRQPRVTAKK